ncbi:hypothetical protein F511_38883 [Dorcoceras hygrometricum]|uniref:Prolamin-like domain-containing protein n=1 Tax=Dorcoceras hygrometricum TaxID=472368 RepID=A0A2Z7B435_9LAMI|nr:hypothetical protein F511_38883 [Dorcoceras hygrometricum]
MGIRGLFLLITVACLVYSTISTRDISDPNQETVDPVGGKNFLGCLSALAKFRPCIGEVFRGWKTGNLDVSPECCGKIILIVQQCWPNMNQNIETTSICGLPSSYDPKNQVQGGDIGN